MEFTSQTLLHAVIGSNGSGKSNLIEAILLILIGCYFEKTPRFEFHLEFETHGQIVVLQRNNGRFFISANGHQIPLSQFSRRLRENPGQDFYPSLILIYYSGECRRVQKLIASYRRHFQKLTRNPETDRFRPLFVQSSNEQSQSILVGLFAHGYQNLLDRLQLEAISDVKIVLCSPAGFDPEVHEPILWNTEGAIRRIVSAIDATSSEQTGMGILEIPRENLADGSRRRIRKPLKRTYHFREGRETGIKKLAQRLQAGGENVYLALESLRARGMLISVSFRLKRKNEDSRFSFDSLSEGEKQLLAVIGAATLTHQKENLILLDEPDTHLNPHWSWDYPSMFAEAMPPSSSSTVLMATHDPVIISGMSREQVLLAHPNSQGFSRPHRNPRGQGIANLLCSAEFFGLPSSLDKETQKLLDERLALSVKETLSDQDRTRLRALNQKLEILPGVSERDPHYVRFLREHPDLAQG
ncbi:MAG: AAA family ATPase [Opitutae bacterium]|nr:AAA family ATPase [Opitutae bacterium]